MTNREFLEASIKHFNGNTRVIGVLKDGTKVTLVSEASGLTEGEFLDVNTGIIFKKEEFVSFANSDFHYGKKRTLNHEARNNYAYLTSGKNHKEEKGALAHLVK
jgi:hypothetical protein